LSTRRIQQIYGECIKVGKELNECWQNNPESSKMLNQIERVQMYRQQKLLDVILNFTVVGGIREVLLLKEVRPIIQDKIFR